MRLTVGPLPSAVYWRRRAVVLGAALIFLIVLVYSCGGPGGSGADPGDAVSPTPTIDAEPTGPVLTPEPGGPSAGGEEPPAGGPDQGGSGAPPGGEVPAPNGGGTVPVPPPAPDGSCTDEEMSVVPLPSAGSVKRGVTIEVQFKIKNISNRTCNRDAGSDAQEIYIRLGAEVIWSSDKCSGPGTSNVVAFAPAIEHGYRVAWNGKDSSRCADGVSSGPVPPAGDYQVFARLGTKLSEPVKLTVTG